MPETHVAENHGARTRGWSAILLAAAARLLLLVGGLGAIGYLWLAVALGAGTGLAWIERSVLMSAVAFTVYWTLGWWRHYAAYRRVLLAITALAVAPALVLVLVIEPWQRADMQRENAIHSNRTHAENAIERFPCPDGALLVLTPWIFLVDGDGLRRLVELRLIPADRQTPSRLLLRHTASGGLAHREELADHRDSVIACIGSSDALDTLVRKMGEGGYE
ncbi:hypothetical protein [Thioalkalivibrio nitratireducens]|nr:hypothetical protein [Thioalkalivibrio nitratireducens]